MAFPYKHVLLVGATSGIGRAMADRLIQAGIKVTAHGEEKASAMNYDISDINGAPQFTADATRQYPDIDCIFLNPGTQRKYDLTDPKDGDLSDFRAEMDVNFISYVALTQAFTPFLLSKSTPTSFIFTSSLLALVPAPRIPAYSAAKAAMNAFLYCLRDQLRESSVKVIDLARV
ncbi:Short-chain dehydrogenase/reductase SDR [Penicillium camemberti]|uniref:Short-chain dehydrogenase/reductase SDR n=1 Tax=Penicillium camemberti (strain FM 013) TaxID=1429867 RepID=A0A0G4PNP2_PENC3|nr:Short-chain dehydrogenase/reductase SDR [Penicillium camemberti]